MKHSYHFLMILFIIGFTTNLYSQSVPSYVPTNGLVGWWGFNGNAQDGSGNGNHGIVNGASLTTDRFGNQNAAYSFDGVDDYIVSIGGSQYLTNNLTISFWVNFMDVQQYTGTLLTLGSQSSCTWGPYYNNFQPGIGNGVGIGCNGQFNGVHLLFIQIIGTTL